MPDDLPRDRRELASCRKFRLSLTERKRDNDGGSALRRRNDFETPAQLSNALAHAAQAEAALLLRHALGIESEAIVANGQREAGRTPGEIEAEAASAGILHRIDHGFLPDSKEVRFAVRRKRARRSFGARGKADGRANREALPDFA